MCRSLSLTVLALPWLAGAQPLQTGGLAQAQGASSGAEAPAQAAQTGDAAQRYSAAIAHAVAEYEMSNFEEARALFLRAHAAMPSARTMRGLGMVEFELKNYVESIAWLERSLTSSAKPLEGTIRAAAAALLARARAFVGVFKVKLEGEQPPLRSFQVLVDGQVRALGPDNTLLLDIGKHTVTVVVAEATVSARNIQVRGGEHQPLLFRRRPDLSPQRAGLERSAAAPGQKTSARLSSTAGEPSGSVFDSPWLWTGVGAVVVGGVVTAIVLASGGGGGQATPLVGDFGPAIRTLSVR